jgi:hypothetical protein
MQNWNRLMALIEEEEEEYDGRSGNYQYENVATATSAEGNEKAPATV